MTQAYHIQEKRQLIFGSVYECVVNSVQLEIRCLSKNIDIVIFIAINRNNIQSKKL